MSDWPSWADYFINCAPKPGDDAWLVNKSTIIQTKVKSVVFSPVSRWITVFLDYSPGMAFKKDDVIFSFDRAVEKFEKLRERP